MADPERDSDVTSLAGIMNDVSAPIERRISALFSLRNIISPESTSALSQAMKDSSALLAHEAAFALGQMGDTTVIPALTSVLEDPNLNPIVRHEAAEALGNLGGAATLTLLKEHLKDPTPEVRETCQLAVRRLQDVVHGSHLRDQSGGDRCDLSTPGKDCRGGATSGCEDCNRGKEVVLGRDSVHAEHAVDGQGEVREQGHGVSVGPGERRGEQQSDKEACVQRFVGVDPAGRAASDEPVEVLRARLMDEGVPLYDRYGALFGLRDLAVEQRNKQASAAIIAGVEACGSALLQHEIAYVLGQIQDKESVSALSRVLSDPQGHPMVRHEAAVALGSVADESIEGLLRAFEKDPEPIVAQSCTVALDMLRS